MIRAARRVRRLLGAAYVVPVPPHPDVFVHVGLSKTGTSYLQHVLWSNRQTLAADGLLVPGDGPLFRSLAVWDLTGRRPRGTDLPQVPGSWQLLVDAVAAWDGARVVLSEEGLALARPRQVRRAVSSLAPAPVHVVVTVRDLMSTIPATWQQELAKGATWTLADYLCAVRDPESGPVGAGVAFWLRQDVTRVLDRWESAVPRERIHLVTVPPPGSPAGLLLQRFAAAVGIDTAKLAEAAYASNASVGVVEAEVLRRLNLALRDRLNERQYTRVVARGVREALQQRADPQRITLPAEHVGWVHERAAAMVGELRSRSYHVCGDLDDLLAGPETAGGPPTIHEEAVAEATMHALRATVEQHAQLWWRTRNKEAATTTDEVSRLASSARAAGYRLRVSGLALANRNRLLRQAVARYLRVGRSG